MEVCTMGSINRNTVCRLVATALALLFITAPLHAGTAKYVFLFIGDGMGIPQRAAAAQFATRQLTIDTLKAQGVTTTHAADRFITGSAASATAMASGTKTNIGMIGMAPDQRHVKTLAEIAKEQGKKVGIVSSVSIDHATPAAFYAHVKSRNQYYDIDVALAESGFDFFGGGGIKDPANKRDNSTAFKGDAMELIKRPATRWSTTRKPSWPSNRPTARCWPTTPGCRTAGPCPMPWT
jgi:alkaline phosphatase